MNFDLSDDQRTIKSTAREFLAARYPLAEVRRLALDDERGWTDQQWNEMVELGWPDIAELGTVEMIVVAEELGYACRADAAAVDVGGRAARRHLDGGRGAVGDRDGAERRRRHRRRARRLGRRRAVRADGRAGPGARSRAPPVPALTFWRRTRRAAALGRGRRAGLAIARSASLDPTRGARGTVQRQVGRGARGDARSAAAATVMSAAESVGVAQRAMEMAVEYAKERKQFDRPIGTYQAVSHACAQMLLEVEGARSAVYWAAWALDFEPETAPLAVSCAKAYAGDAGRRVPRAALQVHGGIGFTWEHDLHFFLKRGEANAHAYGDGAAAPRAGRGPDRALNPARDGRA